MPSQYYYEDKVYNNYLGKNKIIKAKTLQELKYKMHEQLSIWDKQEKNQRLKDEKDKKARKAEKNTLLAQEEIKKYKNLLATSLNKDNKIKFDNYLKKNKFIDFVYKKNKITIEKVYSEFNVPKKTFIEWVFPSVSRTRKLKEEEAKKIYENRIDKEEKNYNEEIEKYNKSKNEFEKSKKEYNDEIYEWKKNYETHEVKAVERYVNEVLNNSIYPDAISKIFEIQYNKNEKTLIILYKIPNSRLIPNITEYKYVKTSDEIKTKEMKKSDFEEYYDDIVYQITLRTINEIFNATYEKCIENIVFNGWVDYVDEATGNDVTSCIISVMVSRKDFLEIDLSRVVCKECIKKLKGIFAGKLISKIPVTPILDISKEDKRFTESKEVLDNINDGTNLASMPWEDFEYLVRELFERKFAKYGYDVKITRSSKDGGVDGVVFDPDPIKGGKFIIQAKRYNNVVPVSAVRDLYGTVFHEHAIKGILVTTSYFGVDSYDFAKDKPLSLINGNELLGLFNEVGYSNLRITLWEDRQSK